MIKNKLLLLVLVTLCVSIGTVQLAYAQETTTPPIDNLTLFCVTLTAILGTLTAAVLGWLDSGEPFNGRKFASSILHAVVAGVVIVIGYSFRTSVDWFDYLIVFLSGAGVDVTLNRISGAIASRNATKTTVTETPSTTK